MAESLQNLVVIAKSSVVEIRACENVGLGA